MRDVLTQVAVSFALDLGRYVLLAVPAFWIFWKLLGRRLASRWLRPAPPDAASISREAWASLRTVAIFALMGGLVHAGRMVGVLKVYGDVAEHGLAYALVTPLVLIVLQDFYFYVTHRAMHHKLLFRAVHLEHHLSRHTSPFTAYAFSPVEALVHASFVPLVTLVMPAHELALFAFLTFMIVRNVLGHLAIELMPAGFARSSWGRHHTTTTHHALHHLRPGTHFGLYFTHWDRWLGTEDATYLARFDEVTRGTPREASRASGVGVG